MKLYDLYLENPSIFKKALDNAMVMKIATDSPQAGGVTIEMNAEYFANEILKETSAPFICLTNKGIERSMKRGYSFDFSLVGANDLDSFKKKTKTSNNIASAADVYLFEVVGETFTLVDAESFKTSTSDSSNGIYLHNDADGSIFRGVESGNHPDFGQVLMLNFSPSTGVCEVYLADGKMSSLTDLFTKSIVKEGEVIFHGDNLKDKSDMTSKTGLNRQLIKLINREKKKKKKTGEALASTSFDRGITLDKSFLPILASRGVINKLYSFTIDFEALEDQDFRERYPQLCKERANDNAA